MNPGDWVNVNFDISGFDCNFPADAAALDDLLYHCYPPLADGQNDGRQFHMSRLEKRQTSGSVGWPYDPASMNAYQVDNEGEDIKPYQVAAEITGDDRDQYKAAVSTFSGGTLTEWPLSHRRATTRHNSCQGNP